MKLDGQLLDSLTEQAKASSRLRMSFDLRNGAEDNSQRVLNALEPGTAVPVHRHVASSETFIVLRGTLRETFFNDKGEVMETFVCQAGTPLFGCNIPKGQWHTAESLESGTVILETKDGKYAPQAKEDVMDNLTKDVETQKYVDVIKNFEKTK